jgi:ATP-binding cassette subfamily E protein 1
MMATYLADQVIVYQGKPSKNCTALSPKSLIEGMNLFLKTLRRDMNSYRPRINKLGSTLDTQQKENGTYFFAD